MDFQHSPDSHSSTPAADLLLSPHLDRAKVVHILEPFGFRDCEKADANLQQMAGDPRSRQLLAVILKDLLDAVRDTGDPDQALNEWERYLEVGGNRSQLFSYFAQAPHILHLISTVFGNSPAMAQVFIRDPLLVYWVNNQQVLRSHPTCRQLHQSLKQAINVLQAHDRKLDAIRRFFRREMLRIGVRDLLHVASVQETVNSLSNLAEVVIQGVYEVIVQSMYERFGVPKELRRNALHRDARFVVLAMGKLGGRELNYSSDVDLVYLCSCTEGRTEDTPQGTSHSNAAFFHQFAQELTSALTSATAEGFLFRVDLRLRPEGAVGPMVASLPDALRYYESRGRDWERLAFLKARPIAGDLGLGTGFLRKLRPFIMGDREQVSQLVVQTIHSLRAQIQTKSMRRGEGSRNVKLSPGGIRDIEWITQGLQLLYCHRYPKMLEKNTLRALRRLKAVGVLSSMQEQQLRRAYLFLRDVEHKLQMEHDLQTHLLPLSVDDLSRCVIRMGYQLGSSQSHVDRFLSECRGHMQQVQRVFSEVFPVG